MMVSFDYNSAVTTLHELRKSGERKSDLVVTLGENLIQQGYAGKLGDEGSSRFSLTQQHLHKCTLYKC
jgi:hypothetical protein